MGSCDTLKYSVSEHQPVWSTKFPRLVSIAIFHVVKS